MDCLTLGVGLFSFLVFLIIHVIAFRWLAPEQLLKSLLVTVLIIMALPAVVMVTIFFSRTIDAPLAMWLLATVLAMAVDGLLCFFYVLCIFGPYETSVRMRLVREIAKGKDIGVSHDEILAQYNAEIMVKIRLQRLIGSGDIVEDNGIYRTTNTGNFFFIFDAIAGVIKRWIGR